MNTPQINDGGPAFPCEEQIRCNGEVIDFLKFPGMTLRDWFAGQTLNGYLASWNDEIPNEFFEPDYVAGRVYEFADAMLKAREVKP